jgi:hypothetical protein
MTERYKPAATFTDLCWAIRLEVDRMYTGLVPSAHLALRRKQENARVDADEREHYAKLDRMGVGA